MVSTESVVIYWIMNCLVSVFFLLVILFYSSIYRKLQDSSFSSFNNESSIYFPSTSISIIQTIFVLHSRLSWWNKIWSDISINLYESISYSLKYKGWNQEMVSSQNQSNTRVWSFFFISTNCCSKREYVGSWWSDSCMEWIDSSTKLLQYSQLQTISTSRLCCVYVFAILLSVLCSIQ